MKQLSILFSLLLLTACGGDNEDQSTSGAGGSAPPTVAQPVNENPTPASRPAPKQVAEPEPKPKSEPKPKVVADNTRNSAPQTAPPPAAPANNPVIISNGQTQTITQCHAQPNSCSVSDPDSIRPTINGQTVGT